MTTTVHPSLWQRARRPVLSVLLALAWLMLQQSIDPGNLLTACVLGWGLPRLLTGFLGPAAQPRAWGRAVRLAFTVLWDIVVSTSPWHVWCCIRAARRNLPGCAYR